jgi:hypothetical protein
MFYSDKKKRYTTVQIQIMVNNRGYILHKVSRKEKYMIIYSIYKENHSAIPKEVVTVIELEYLGLEKDYSEQLSALPYKKKINQCLSQEEKYYNTVHSKKRIVLEHTVSSLKKYRIMIDIFRNKFRKYNRISDIVAGLINYRIMNKYR